MTDQDLELDREDLADMIIDVLESYREAIDAVNELEDQLAETKRQLRHQNVEVRADLYDAGVIDKENWPLLTDREKIRSTRQTIAQLEQKYDEGAPADEVVMALEAIFGLTPDEAEHEIEKLKKQGEVYEPTTDHLRTT